MQHLNSLGNWKIFSIIIISYGFLKKAIFEHVFWFNSLGELLRRFWMLWGLEHDSVGRMLPCSRPWRWIRSRQHLVGVVKIPSQNCLKGSHISPQTWKLLKKISGTKNLNQTRLMPMIDPQAYCIWRDNPGKKSSQPLTHAVMFCNQNCLKSSQHSVGVVMIFPKSVKKSSQNLGHLATA